MKYSQVILIACIGGATLASAAPFVQPGYAVEQRGIVPQKAQALVNGIRKSTKKVLTGAKSLGSSALSATGGSAGLAKKLGTIAGMIISARAPQHHPFYNTLGVPHNSRPATLYRPGTRPHHRHAVHPPRPQGSSDTPGVPKLPHHLHRPATFQPRTRGLNDEEVYGRAFDDSDELFLRDVELFLRAAVGLQAATPGEGFNEPSELTRANAIHRPSRADPRVSGGLARAKHGVRPTSTHRVKGNSGGSYEGLNARDFELDQLD
ncbi:hypothetical protein DXG03_001535 [Asterophora parasitica]|uniref:Uncharacterized protein n=1 Tax=Asterophora parasitica TaxID=117018 RepID=A0A9P7G3W2_9AGAR|nr:hypothetical protein DXG03_001535 [Asterophora parasitica]